MASEQTSQCPECGETPDSPTFYRHRVCKQSAARSLDFEKTQLQQTGSFSTIGLTLAQVVKVVIDIGLRLDEVEIAHGIAVKR